MEGSRKTGLLAEVEGVGEHKPLKNLLYKAIITLLLCRPTFPIKTNTRI